jgi:hypothetical protein
MALHAYHPETGASVMVEQGQLDHMRMSGWMLRSEYDANQVADQERADAAASAKSASKTADKKES